jgi:phenylalanyl-tRNA synthetase beta chain
MQRLYKLAKKNPSKYLKNINLFDVYEGKNLPEGKKSYALSFELLNEEKL